MWGSARLNPPPPPLHVGPLVVRVYNGNSRSLHMQTNGKEHSLNCVTACDLMKSSAIASGYDERGEDKIRVLRAAAHVPHTLGPVLHHLVSAPSVTTQVGTCVQWGLVHRGEGGAEMAIHRKGPDCPF
jgi:hypothetical protein